MTGAPGFVIVRHGNTFAPGDPPRRIGARTDLPLVASGIAQAEALRDAFARRGLAFARVLASPLRRTRETAAIVAPHVTAEPAGFLREIDHGPDEGRTEAEVLARIGADALARWEAAAEPPPEWIVDAPARIAAWRTLLVAPFDGPTLLVTSNGAARYARIALGQAPARLRTGAWAEIAAGPPPAITDWDVRP